ncbi:pilin [Patescibacteria group bacterium]
MKFVPKYFITIVIFVCLFVIFFHIADAIVIPENELNPLGVKGVAGISTVIGRVIKAILGIVGAFALTMVVTGGIFLLTAAGNQDKVKKGKDVLTWAVIGIMIVISSFMMVDYIIKAITLGGGSTPPPPTTANNCAGDCLKCTDLDLAAGCSVAEAEAKIKTVRPPDKPFTCSAGSGFDDCQTSGSEICCDWSGDGDDDGGGDGCETDLDGVCAACADAGAPAGCTADQLEDAFSDLGFTLTCGDAKGVYGCAANARCCK